MRTSIAAILLISTILAPNLALAQHGRGGGGWGGGGGAGGFRGGGGGGSMGGSRGGMATASRPSATNASRAAYHPAPYHNMAYGNRPNYHGNWYHGDWHGHWGQPWGYRPYGWGWGPGAGWGFGVGFGLGVATVGVMSLGSPWGWGYYGYYNPYWVAPAGGVTYINYSQPVVMAQPVAPAASQPVYQAPAYNQSNPYAGQTFSSQTPPPNSGLSAEQQRKQDEALAIFENARSLFSRGEYRAALAQTDRAIADLPNDSVMHEFRALCLYALGDYQQAAAAVYAVVSVGPGWDWTTVSNLYPNPAVYSQHLAQLERYTEAHPDVAPAKFLLAYHYLLSGHNDQAKAELEQVVQLEPRDTLSAQLLKGMTTPAAAGPQGFTPEPERKPSLPVDPASVAGDWKASRPDGSKFEMVLGQNNQFTWKYSQQDKQQAMSGTYTLADNYLILKASDQNALIGQVELEAKNQLHFKLNGGNPADPGLTFTR